MSNKKDNMVKKGWALQNFSLQFKVGAEAWLSNYIFLALSSSAGFETTRDGSRTSSWILDLHARTGHAQTGHAQAD